MTGEWHPGDVSVESEKARIKVLEAQQERDSIAALPTHVGARLKWPNGVIWVRVGDDAWSNEEILKETPADYSERCTRSSAHIVSRLWMVLDD